MSIYKPTDRREAKRSIIVLIIVLVVAVVLISLAISFALGGGHRDEIKFQIYSSGECTYTFTYLDGNGIHQSQNTVYGNYWVSVTGAQNANVIVFSEVAVTVEAYVNGNLVDRQTGTSVMVSATA